MAKGLAAVDLRMSSEEELDGKLAEAKVDGRLRVGQWAFGTVEEALHQRKHVGCAENHAEGGGDGPPAAAASSDPALPFRHSMPYSDEDCDSDPSLSIADERQSPVDHETDTDTQLVTETLVEEVSIDGMCGVY